MRACAWRTTARYVYILVCLFSVYPTAKWRGAIAKETYCHPRVRVNKVARVGKSHIALAKRGARPRPNLTRLFAIAQWSGGDCPARRPQKHAPLPLPNGTAARSAAPVRPTYGRPQLLSAALPWPNGMGATARIAARSVRPTGAPNLTRLCLCPTEWGRPPRPPCVCPQFSVTLSLGNAMEAPARSAAPFCPPCGRPRLNAPRRWPRLMPWGRPREARLRYAHPTGAPNLTRHSLCPMEWGATARSSSPPRPPYGRPPQLNATLSLPNGMGAPFRPPCGRPRLNAPRRCPPLMQWGASV